MKYISKEAHFLSSYPNITSILNNFCCFLRKCMWCVCICSVYACVLSVCYCLVRCAASVCVCVCVYVAYACVCICSVFGYLTCVFVCVCVLVCLACACVSRRRRIKIYDTSIRPVLMQNAETWTKSTTAKAAVFERKCLKSS